MALAPLTRMILALDELRKIDQEMPAQIAVTLLAIARKPGLNQQEARKIAGLEKSAVSRVFTRLSNLEGGLGLIAMIENPQDRRFKNASLTPKGERVVRSIQQHMVEDPELFADSAETSN